MIASLMRLWESALSFLSLCSFNAMISSSLNNSMMKSSWFFKPSMMTLRSSAFWRSSSSKRKSFINVSINGFNSSERCFLPLMFLRMSLSSSLKSSMISGVANARCSANKEDFSLRISLSSFSNICMETRFSSTKCSASTFTYSSRFARFRRKPSNSFCVVMFLMKLLSFSRCFLMNSGTIKSMCACWTLSKFKALSFIKLNAKLRRPS